MLGIFLIICMAAFVLVDLKAYFALKDDSDKHIELSPEARTYELCTSACKLNAVSFIIALIGYLGCMLPYFFIEGIETNKYIICVISFGIFPILIISYLCYLSFKCPHGYLTISSDKIEYKRRKLAVIQVDEIKYITCPAFDCFQVHLKKSAKKKALNLNIRNFHKRKEIFSLMEQLRDHIAETSGKPKRFAQKMRRFQWKLERLGYAYIIFIKSLLFLALLYTSYCCIDYDFFRKDYTALYNALDADSTQSENAWDYYVQAAVNYVELDDELQTVLDDISEPNQLNLTGDQKETLAKWFHDNESSWNSLKQATSIDYCNAAYETISILEDKDEDDFSSPTDAGYDQIKNLLKNVDTARLSGIINIDGFELFEIQLAASKHFTQGKSFIDQLVGYAMLYRAVNAFSNEDSYTHHQLQQVREALKELFPDGIPELRPDGEILIACNTYIDMINQFKIPIQTPFNPMFLILGSSRSTEKYAQNHLKSILEDTEKGIEINSDVFSITNFPIMRKLLFNLLDSSVSKIYKYNLRADTTLSAAYVICDLEVFKLSEGHYPETIQQLRDAGLTSPLPDDPDTDGSIIYSNNGNRAILYAVDNNGIDDGGYKDDKDSDGNRQRDDRIFWERKL